MQKNGVPVKNVYTVMGEIQDPATQQELVKGTVKKFGRLDVLVSQSK